MGDPQQLSRPAAIIIGVLTIASGAIPLALMLNGVVRPTTPSSGPTWLGIAIALVFIFAGVSIIFDYAIGHGRNSDGTFLPGTPTSVRMADTMLGLTIVGLMALIFGWVAFGPGRREFSGFVAIPFLAEQWRPGELTGRIAFGVVTVMAVALFVGFGVSALRRVRRGFRSPN